MNFFLEPQKKKIKNETRYEIFRQKPLTLTLLLDVEERLVALKELKLKVILQHLIAVVDFVNSLVRGMILTTA